MEKILIVEDEVVLIKALKLELENVHYKVFEAKNGQESLDIALKEHPDLILLDLEMPVMDGITALKKLREDSWGKNVKVLLLTNSDNMDNIADAAELNSVGYLIKSDWNLKAIATKVKEVLAS